MPSDSDRTELASAAAPGSPGHRVPPASGSTSEPTSGPTSGSAAGSTSGPGSAPSTERRPVWPVTAIVVLLGWCLIAWTVFGMAISTAPFFGDIPSRARYIESGMLALTALLPLAVLLVLAVLTGSRWGLALLAVPAALLVPMGLSMLAQDGDPADPGSGRAVRFGDAFQDLTRLNWLVAAVLLALLALVVWRRRRR